MEPRRLPDLLNNLEWNIVGRESLQAKENGDGTYTPIPPRNWVIENSHVVVVGVKSTMAMPNWYTGGWVSQQLSILPGSTSDFVAQMQTGSQRIRLGILNLLVFPKHLDVWILYLKIPKWIKQADVEVWRYDGRDLDLFYTGSTESDPFQVDQSTIPITLLPTNPDRRGATILNSGTARLAIELNGVPSFTTSFVILDPTGYYELPFGFQGAVNGVWELAGNGHAEIREFI